ncbi:hypothetical protein [Xylocopilactobacillus apis]|uniref:Uncharacterized protein n=1 Tax=Xylocopilactobacillus apis TaxID=2932183 RepID=A0AAU9D5F2_9LACO|nr:hypothetical protein [Xylocopilactobacillus apis]BDR57500.1 hypothetical protein KIMC2_20620 [Xylocopilactobacillus apis]
MQLKAYKSEIEKVIISGKLEDIAYKISSIKNEKLKTDYARLGLSDNGSDNIYHYITRDEGKLVIHETAYPLVNINNLKEFNMTKTSFSFTDGLKDYKFTFGDSQIWMKFGKTSDCTLIDEIYVGIIDDPFQFLKEAFENRNKIVLYDDIKPKEKSDAVYLPLYSIQGKGEVPSKSGLNAFNGAKISWQ